MKSYTDIDQSKALAKILSPESADMVYLYWVKGDSQSGIEEGIDTIPTIRERLPIEKCDIPCWSLASLLDVLPAGTETNKQTDGSILCYYVGVYNNKKYFSTKRYDNLIDACYEMILKLHELKML